MFSVIKFITQTYRAYTLVTLERRTVPIPMINMGRNGTISSTHNPISESGSNSRASGAQMFPNTKNQRPASIRANPGIRRINLRAGLFDALVRVICKSY
jgi:hypothetical protein